MRQLIIISVFLSFAVGVSAQNILIKQANDKYHSANYAEAAALYEKILKDGIAPEVYFNLGNTYYKMNEIGKSILNYERALRLDPQYDDARFNLQMAQLKVIDTNTQSNTFFLKRWVDSFIKSFSSNQWFVLGTVFFITCLILVFIFVFASSIKLRKISFYMGLIILSFSVLFNVFAAIRKKQMTAHNEAIIMTGAVVVKSSPDKSGTDLFQLHEGTKLTIKSTLGKWVEIRLGNGNVGWMEEENIERI